jgi:hypothetical protein
MRILNVADFNWMTGAERHTARLSLFDICRKLTLAATRADHLVVEYSDRAVARMGAPFGLRRFGTAWANRRFLQCVDELKPDLIFLSFADRIRNASLKEARRLSPGVVIVEVNIDPIDTIKNQRRLGMRRDTVDALFATTAEPALAAAIGSGAFAAFMPNPVDRAIESGRGFEASGPRFDLLFPAHDDRPREIGGSRLRPSDAVRRLESAAPSLRLSTPGVAGQPEVAGVNYFNALQSARMGWSLSRRASLPLYASDRMAHMFGWGLAVFVDAQSGFQRFYSPDEAVFYRGIDDLAYMAVQLSADDDRARSIARKGWEKTWALFESGRVFGYILDQLFDEGGAKGYEWPCDRWRP